MPHWLRPDTLPWNICDAINPPIASDIAIAYRITYGEVESLTIGILRCGIPQCSPMVQSRNPTASDDLVYHNRNSLKADSFTYLISWNAIFMTPFHVT